MSNKAHVSSDILQVLMDGFQNCASSTAVLRGSVRAHITECLNAAKDIINRLKQIEQSAQQNYDRCSNAYYACQRSQRYDEESGEYRPSCSCEERDLRRADNELYKARSAREQAEKRLRDMELEVSYYEQPHGGEGLMNSITNEFVPNATNRLMALNDKVIRYETLEVTGCDIGDSSSSTPILSTSQSKVSIFGKGKERLEEKMKANEFRKGIEKVKELERRAIISKSYCNKCRCAPCQCDRVREY